MGAFLVPGKSFTVHAMGAFPVHVKKQRKNIKNMEAPFTVHAMGAFLVPGQSLTVHAMGAFPVHEEETTKGNQDEKQKQEHSCHRSRAVTFPVP